MEVEVENGVVGEERRISSRNLGSRRRRRNVRAPFCSRSSPADCLTPLPAAACAASAFCFSCAAGGAAGERAAAGR